MKVVSTFLRAGIPLSKLDTFRDLFEEGAYRLIDKRHMSDLVPFVLKKEEGHILNKISGKALSVILMKHLDLGKY